MATRVVESRKVFELKGQKWKGEKIDCKFEREENKRDALIKALEDLSIQYDYTVRNSKAQVVQFAYGDDGLDPMHMEADKGKPINFAATTSIYVEHQQTYTFGQRFW